MARYIAVFTTDASTTVEFEADMEDDLNDAAALRGLEEAAHEAFQRTSDTGLCYSCAHKVTLGDFSLNPDDIEEVRR